MRTQIFVLISLTVCLCSCKNSKTGKLVDNPDLKTIDVGKSIGKGRIVNISEIATDIKYVPLETNKSSLIGKGAVVFYENGRIYVRFLRTILQVFDSTGKYLFTFNKIGRGPQEYIDGLIQIEKGTGNINVFESKGNIASIKRYSPEGKFLSNILLKNPVDLSTRRANQLSESLYLIHITNRITKNDVEYFALIVDTLSNIREMIPSPDIKMNKSSETKYVGKRVMNISASKPPLYVNYYKDSLRICVGLGNTIFSFDHEKGTYPRYHIDYGKYRDFGNKNTTSSENPDRPITAGGHYYIENDNFLILSVELGDYAHEPFIGKRWMTFDMVMERRYAYGLFNKKTGEFALLNQPVKGIPGFRDDILKGPPVVVHHLSEDNTGSHMILATDFKDYVSKNSTSSQLKKIADNLKDEDNPVIALFKVR